jgi:hypothetical protein
MNYKVIRANPDFGLGVGDVIEPCYKDFMQQTRNGEPIDTFSEPFINLFHEAGYLEPFPERKVLKLEVEFEKINNQGWNLIHKGKVLHYFHIKSECNDYFDNLLAESEADNDTN